MAILRRDESINTNILKSEINDLMKNHEVIDAAVTVTSDGRFLEKVERKKYPLKRIATMGSSLMSLGDTITAELNMGNCRNLISENEGGIIAYMHINEDIVLVTLTHNTSALGLLLSATRNCCNKVRERLS